jgi:ribosome biogenesis protein
MATESPKQCSFISAAETNHKAQPFDFVVAGDLVQMRLQHFLDAKGIQPVWFC